LALGHNGNLVNATELREQLAGDGVKLVTTSDTEVIAALIANDPAPLDEAFTNAIARLEGAFSVTALAEGKLIGFRDPHGFRPLVLGRLDGDWVLASETCALDLVGAELEREVGLGELVVIDDDGCRAEQAVPQANGGALCMFEFFYLARPDTRLAGVEVHGPVSAWASGSPRRRPSRRIWSCRSRTRAHRRLIGFARATGIDFSEGLIKNRYVGRTFIQPDQGLREQGVS